MVRAYDFLYSWNPAAAPLLAKVKIEDDSLRDGLQGAFVHKPSIEEKKELVGLSVAVGTQAAMLGFPASSEIELQECRALLAFLDANDFAIVPRFLARAMVSDVEPILVLRQDSSRDVWADVFIGCSPLRRYVEKWAMSELLDKIRRAGEFLTRNGVPFGVSLEDATRTPPADLRQFVDASLDCGAKVITVCDTVGESTPAGAARLVSFVKELASQGGAAAEVWWHGHDDRGLSLANAIAAAEAGAETISGSFLGIGERSGNTPLEQLIMFLSQCGHTGYRVAALEPYCRRLAEVTYTPVPLHAPLIGPQAFATCTGTHSAALLKARRLGPDFEDYVFSSIPASALGRAQQIAVGPTSGVANIRHALQQLHIEASDEDVRRLLELSKTRNRLLTLEEIRGLCAGQSSPVTREGE